MLHFGHGEALEQCRELRIYLAEDYALVDVFGDSLKLAVAEGEEGSCRSRIVTDGIGRRIGLLRGVISVIHGRMHPFVRFEASPRNAQPANFWYRLTKNPTSQLHHRNCAVMP